MHISQLDYHLPAELIAQQPATPRDSSNLLVYERASGKIRHRSLPELLSYLGPRDILVYNDSRVIKARVFARRRTGGRVELLFLRRREPGSWEVLARPSARLKEGEGLDLPPLADDGRPAVPSEQALLLEERLGRGRWLLRNTSGMATESLLELAGEMPLPPYIREELKQPERYQTIYAAAPGSAAAPTAGLHFTPELLERLRSTGAGLFPVTLHIGLDTFRPIEEDDLGHHQIHTEQYHMPAETQSAVEETRRQGGKVIAIGTTAVRVLETVFGKPGSALSGETDIFITPGYRFQAVDALLTNFHLPRSTLLALVMAFAGVEEIRGVYQEAVKKRYRFFSFGDAMLVL